MNFRKLAAFAFVLGICPAGLNAAQADTSTGDAPADLTGRWELGAQIGGLLIDEQSVKEPHMLSGGRFGYYVNNEWSVEANVLAGKVTAQYPTSEDSARVIIPTVEALYYGCSEGNFRPFLAAGVGVAAFDGAEGADDTHFAMNLGGGAKYFIAEELALRVDGRWLLNTEGGADLNEATLTGGLSWIFPAM